MIKLKKDRTVILDLDETLVSSVPAEDFKFDSQIEKEKAKKLRFYNLDGTFLVFQRPECQKFLDKVFEKFNVIVWSAGSKDYVLDIVGAVFGNRVPDLILWKHHCELSKKCKYSRQKDIRLLKYEFKIELGKKPTLIDDLGSENARNHDVIKIKEWNFTDDDSLEDKELMSIFTEI